MSGQIYILQRLLQQNMFISEINHHCFNYFPAKNNTILKTFTTSYFSPPSPQLCKDLKIRKVCEISQFKLLLLPLVPLHQTLPPPRLWRLGTVGTQTPDHSC